MNVHVLETLLHLWISQLPGLIGILSHELISYLGDYIIKDQHIRCKLLLNQWLELFKIDCSVFIKIVFIKELFWLVLWDVDANFDKRLVEFDFINVSRLVIVDLVEEDLDLILEFSTHDDVFCGLCLLYIFAVV